MSKNEASWTVAISDTDLAFMTERSVSGALSVRRPELLRKALDVRYGILGLSLYLKLYFGNRLVGLLWFPSEMVGSIRLASAGCWPPLHFNSSIFLVEPQILCIELHLCSVLCNNLVEYQLWLRPRMFTGWQVLSHHGCLLLADPCHHLAWSVLRFIGITTDRRWLWLCCWCKWVSSSTTICLGRLLVNLPLPTWPSTQVIGSTCRCF